MIQLGKTLLLVFAVLSIDTVINLNKNTSLENNGANFSKHLLPQWDDGWKEFLIVYYRVKK